MSRRGGGRRGDNRRDQPSPAPAQSFQRGGGGDLAGRGRGGRGRGSYAGASEASSIPQASPPVPSISTAAPAPAQSFQRGGGRGGSTSGGRGRGSYAGASEALSIPQASPPVPSTSTAAPARVPQPGSASASSSTMIQEMDKKLTLADPTEAVPPMSSKARRPPMRPGYGTVGTKCMVRANHFLVQVADRDIHHYDVSISPEVTSKKVNRDILAQLTRLYGESHLDRRIPAYDGMKSLYTAGPLPFESKEFVVILEQDSRGSSSNSTRKERKFKVTIKLASKPDLYTLQQFLRRRHMDAPYEVVQVLDVVLRASPSEKHVVVGRSFFSPKLGPMGELGDGIDYWRGFYQSLRPTQMGLSFNIDISARGFYEPILVSDFVAKYINRNPSPLPDQDRVKVRKSLKGIKVALTHMDYTKSYKITGVSSQPLSQLTFTLDDQVTRTSVVQYFREKYNVVLEYTFLPALLAGSEAKPIYLPMELARIVEGQRYSKRLNERQVTALLRATCQRPFDRENNIRKMVLSNDYNGDKLVNEFGIHVGDELTMVDARVLPPPMLNYHATGRESKVNPSFGQWNMINKRMINGGRVEYWTCVCFSTRVNRDFPFQFCEELANMCTSKGMEFNPNPLIPIISASPGQIERVLTDVHKKSTTEIARRGQHGKQLQLLIIILPDQSGSYGKIKRVCETTLGIVTQCCAPKQAQKFSKQYFENLSLKINVKVGGRNTVLNDAIQRRIPHVSVQPTIIFGADVTHPQPGEDSSPSIAAVVASMDWPEVTKYRGIVSAQTHREEIIKDLYTCQQDAQKGLVHGGMIRELLRAFRLSTGHKPYKIIFYRDGVSEGQFNQVLLHEVDAIRQACTSLEPEYMPPITFIVVQKRHHTRLFPADHRNRSMTDKSGNILPGTVVDTKICHPSEFDFYLNSHAGIQGTSRPTHYHVLFDENNFSANDLQVLTNNLCYTYARCTRSVSIVPPAYYAHLAAFRARYYLEDASDSGSSGQRGTRERNLEVQLLPAIKENVKDVMFFC